MGFFGKQKDKTGFPIIYDRTSLSGNLFKNYLPGLCYWEKYDGSGYFDDIAGAKNKFINMGAPVIIDNIDSVLNSPSIINEYTANFYFKAAGYLYIDYPALYHFSTNSDDSSLILIDDNDCGHKFGQSNGIDGTGWVNGKHIFLKIGYHKFEYFYNQLGGYQLWQAAWFVGGTRTIIPKEKFFHLKNEDKIV